MHLLMDTKRGENDWWSFLLRVFFFFLIPRQDPAMPTTPTRDIIHCTCVCEGGEQEKGELEFF